MAEVIDRRAARTRKALHNAFLSLILRKGYDETTVQDIIDEADVGRSTFYGHYTGKEDLLRRGFETLRRELAEAQRAARAKPDRSHAEPLGFSLAMFEHAAGYADIFRALVGGRGGTVAVNEIRNVIAELVRKELAGSQNDGVVSRELVVQFIVGAFLSVLTWWLERRPRLTPSEVDALFRRLVLYGIAAQARTTFREE